MIDKKHIKIGIIGKMGSGKSTLANKIIEYFRFKGITVHKHSFAEGVYKIARELFGMTHKNRLLLQSIGSKMREIDDEVWVKDLLKKSHKNIIVDDVRYKNEIKSLKKNGFILIKLDIPTDIQIQRLSLIYNGDPTEFIHHSSENFIDLVEDKDIDFRLIYDYDFNEIKLFLDSIFL